MNSESERQARPGTSERKGSVKIEDWERVGPKAFRPLLEDPDAPWTTDCRRCGEEHGSAEVVVRGMGKPIVDEGGVWGWYWMCPNGGGPVPLLSRRHDEEGEADG